MNQQQCADGYSQSYVPMYRAVRAEELEEIQRTNQFRNPEGIEVKYFVLTVEEAERYAKLAVQAFRDSPYSIVRTAVVAEILDREGVAVTVDGGIRTYVLTSEMIEGLKPELLH